jgi:hypothetical protein
MRGIGLNADVTAAQLVATIQVVELLAIFL